MEKIVVLSEKKTLAELQAKAIAKALKGTLKKEKNFYVINAKDKKVYVIYTYGHILEVDLNKTFGDRENIKIVKKNEIKYKIKKGRFKLFKDIEKLIRQADKIIIATDPDREGELLAREVIYFLKVKKDKIYRWWFSSLDEKHLKETFLKVKKISCNFFEKLYQEGFLRFYFDLNFGINASRILQKKENNKNLSIGRVQTPTLILIKAREEEIKNFKKEKYYKIEAILEKNNKKFKASKIIKKEKDNKIDIEKLANEVLSYLKEKKSLKCLKIEHKKEKIKPPCLPSLADLQISVGKKLKVSASQVLLALQRMYENKIITYPRTESKFLHEKDLSFLERALKVLKREDLIEKIEKYKKRFINNKDVEEKGHSAILIIDDIKKLKNASKLELALYEEIKRRILANLYEDALILKTTYTFEKDLKSKGKVILKEGFLKVYKIEEEKEDEENKFLPEIKEGEEVKKISERKITLYTSPPPRYTSATLISTLKKLNLGTQATRHLFEEILLKRGFIKKDKKGQIYLTNKGEEFFEKYIKEKKDLFLSLTKKMEQLIKEGNEKDALKQIENILKLF